MLLLCQKGVCGIGAKARVSSSCPHYGEESVLVGDGGSGTIFFAGCNLSCVFCQNYDISQFHHGNEIDDQVVTVVNVMDQYRPAFRAHNFPEIDRPITYQEYRTVYEYAKKKGLRLADQI